jgi:hypothetical protein
MITNYLFNSHYKVNGFIPFAHVTVLDFPAWAVLATGP